MSVPSVHWRGRSWRRTRIREKKLEIEQLCRSEGDLVPRRKLKKVMKLTQRRVKLLQTLNIREAFVSGMIDFYRLAVMARRMGISLLREEPDIYKQEALKYAKMFGDNYIHLYNKRVNN